MDARENRTLGQTEEPARSQRFSVTPNRWVYALVKYFFREAFIGLWRGQIVGLEHVPKTGGFILVANHVSYLDPPFLGSFIPRAIFYFARDTLFRPGFMRWLLGALHCIPIRRDAKSDVSAIKNFFKILDSGEGIVMFPEGTRSPDGRLQPVRNGIGMLACRSQVPVVPAYIDGTFEALGRSMKWLSFKYSIKITYAAPLYPKSYDPGPDHPERYQYAADAVMNAIARLGPPAGRDASLSP